MVLIMYFLMVRMILINKFQWRKLQQKKSNEENWIYKFTIRKCKWVDRQSSWNMESIFLKRNIINFCFSGFFKLVARKVSFPKYYKFVQSLEKSLLKYNKFFKKVPFLKLQKKKISDKNIRSFLIFGQESSISQNIRKIFLEKI